MYRSANGVWAGFLKNILLGMETTSGYRHPRGWGVIFAWGYACVFVLPFARLLLSGQGRLPLVEIGWLAALRALANRQFTRSGERNRHDAACGMERRGAGLECPNPPPPWGKHSLERTRLPALKLGASPNFHAYTGTRLQRCTHMRANTAPGESQVVLLQNSGENHLHFDLRECCPNAVTRAAAEGQECVWSVLAHLIRGEAVGSKAAGLCQ